jgi:outer membrane murein-binding lipoprotein Lpp
LIVKEEFNMRTFIKKLSSRKLWACIAGVAVGIATALGADSSTIQTISGAVISAVSLITYIRAEAKIDAAGIGSTAEINAVIDKVKETVEKVTDAVDAVKTQTPTSSDVDSAQKIK